ncbi:MAG: hypothetical protein HYY16_00980 [Planctomycetes bacterium]|nr:hypothetical protein [Planctomycetota bacterium]
MRIMAGILGISGALALAPTTLVWAQSTTLVSQNWDSGLGGWTTTNTSPTVTWSADGTPAGVPGGADTSAPNSANYNNGVDYAGASSGTLTSPSFNLAGMLSATLTFQCNYVTETDSANSYDLRTLQISNDDFGTTVLAESLGSTGASAVIGSCAAMGTWHTHTVTLDPAWGSVQVRFAFDSIDDWFNEYPGWFVDDVEVTAVVPPLPPNNPLQLRQVDGPGGTNRSGGYQDPDGEIVFGAEISDPNAADTIHLEVEVKPLGESFNGTGVLVGNSVPASGGLSEVTATFANGRYRWRARAADGDGMASDWVSINAGTEFDFAVSVPGTGRENRNGDTQFYRTLCAQAAGSSSVPSAPLAVLVAMSLILLRKR